MRGIIAVMLWLELVLTVTAILLAFICPAVGSRFFQPFERKLVRLASRKVVSILLVGVAALALRALLLPIEPIPQPGIQDDFSTLLAADTFAHGRVANPTHPMWVHFETFHVNQNPTYGSMIYPGQAIPLAFGQIAFGNPFWGVWLSAGIMCAAICWMLQGFVPPIWALLGASLAVFRFATFSYWANSYSGGAVAAIGGALVIGALFRIQRRQRLSDALVMGIGLAILANTRPYEGIFFALPVAISMLAWLWHKRGGELSRAAVYVVLPLILVLVLAGSAMSYYFWRTTGSPFRTPYAINLSAYNPVPYFPFLPVRVAPEYHHEVMQRFYLGWCLQRYEFARSHPGVSAAAKVVAWWLFFLGPVFTAPVVGIVLAKRPKRSISRNKRLLILTLGCSVLGSLLPIYFDPKYVAASTCVVLGLIMVSLQHIRKWKWRGKPVGLAFVRAVIVIPMIMFGVRAAIPLMHRPLPPELPVTWYSPPLYGQFDRMSVVAQMRPSDRELVFVRYGLNHNVGMEWVYNDAEIDHSRVVWARDMGDERNQELIKYYKDRRAWLFEPDHSPPVLLRYEEQASTRRIFGMNSAVTR